MIRWLRTSASLQGAVVGLVRLRAAAGGEHLPPVVEVREEERVRGEFHLCGVSPCGRGAYGASVGQILVKDGARAAAAGRLGDLLGGVRREQIAGGGAVASGERALKGFGGRAGRLGARATGAAGQEQQRTQSDR